MAPLFSIIIPTFNRGYILWKTLLSVQRQTWPQWEVHVVDDGSTDNTKQVVGELSSDPRIHYHYQENAGPAAARNLGMSKARGEIITFIDSDDPVYPHYLAYGKETFSSSQTVSWALVIAISSMSFMALMGHFVQESLR